VTEVESVAVHTARARTSLLVGACFGGMVLLEIWTGLSLSDSSVRTSLIIAILAGSVGAFMAGNTYASKSARRRAGIAARHSDDVQALEQLKHVMPLKTLRHRLLIAGAVCALAAGMFGATLGFAANGHHVSTAVIDVIAGGIFVLLCYLAGTLSKPLE
jgi:hypothetical protein